MLSRDFGRLIKQRRAELGIAQDALSKRAGVSRAVISKLEGERGAPVQTDVLDRLLEGLGTRATIAAGAPLAPGRVLERLRHQLRQEELRQRHLRVALDLCALPRDARVKIQRARGQVDLWEERKSCSPRYIERWREALAGAPRAVALAMVGFGDWENAMYQNTPWAFMWK